MSRRSARTGSSRRRSAPGRTNSSRSTPASSWCSKRSRAIGASRRAERLVMKVIPDEATRLAALTRGEIDVAYSIRGELAEELQKTPGLTLKAPVPGSQWLYFADQWDPKSPWHDERVRLAAHVALHRGGIKPAPTPGPSKHTRSNFP